METKSQRLSAAIDFLKKKGEVSSLEDVASRVDRSKNNISSAINGDKRYLSDKFLKHFNACFGNIFNLDWLIDGMGSMCCAPTSDINTLFNIGDDNTNNLIVGANEAALLKENEMLKKLLEEKERMIQVLLNQKK